MGRIHLDYYATLDVTPEASDDEIKRAYRTLALRYHPDRNQGDAKAEEKIREINAAYEVLGDPETRKSYERLRFGGHGRKTDFAGEEATEDVLSPGVILDSMEKKLWEEGRVEIFRKLMNDLPLVKRELATIRAAVVEELGYDKFREELVKQRAAHVIVDLVTPEMDERRTQLLDIASQMMLSQGVGGWGHGEEWVERQLAAAFHRGRIDGFCEACELLYVRR